eukprot:724214-Hanusia_phi.AAC.1
MKRWIVVEFSFSMVSTANIVRVLFVFLLCKGAFAMLPAFSSLPICGWRNDRATGRTTWHFCHQDDRRGARMRDILLARSGGGARKREDKEQELRGSNCSDHDALWRLFDEKVSCGSVAIEIKEATVEDVEVRKR